MSSQFTASAGRAKVLAACPAPDILVNNAGGPPLGDFREWNEADWIPGAITPLSAAVRARYLV